MRPKPAARDPNAARVERGAAARRPRIDAARRPGHEAALIAAARAGDRQALGRLLEQVSAPAFRFSRRFCRDPDDADDLVQEVLAALMASLASFRNESSLSTWAFVVARRACARMRGRQARQSRLDDLPAGAEPHGDRRTEPEARLERRRIAQALERAIAELPSPQREALLLRDVEGLSARAAGRVLGIGERALKSRLHRARAAVRERMAPMLGREVASGIGGRTGRRCPDTVRLLSRHLEGELTAGACARMERHVRHCLTCDAACQSLREVLGACRAYGERPIPAEFGRSLRAAIRRAVREQDAIAGGTMRRPPR